MLLSVVLHDKPEALSCVTMWPDSGGVGGDTDVEDAVVALNDIHDCRQHNTSELTSCDDR